MTTCERHICVAKSVVWCPATLQFVHDVALDVSGVSRLEERTLATYRISYMVLMLRAAVLYLTNPARPKGDFSLHAFYRAGAQLISTLEAQLSEDTQYQPDLVCFVRFNKLLYCKILQFKSSKFKTRISEMFPNGMQLFHWARSDLMECFKL